MENDINRYAYRYLDFLMWNIRKRYISRKDAYDLYTINKEYVNINYMQEIELELYNSLVNEFEKEVVGNGADFW